MKYTNLEILGAFSRIELMNDFDIATLFENFNILKQDPKYSQLLEEYTFDDNGISTELISDIVTAIRNDDVMITNKKCLYFKLEDKLVQKIINDVPNKKICYSFVNDYRNLLMEKEQNKQK